MAKRIREPLRQLNLFFDDVKTRERINGLCQFRYGDKFYNYSSLDVGGKPTVIEILSKKKYQGPTSTVEYIRRGETERLTIKAVLATSHVDSGTWSQLAF